MLSGIKSKSTFSRPVFWPFTQINLHAMLTSAGYERQTSPDYDWHGLRRGKAEFILFQYTISGKGMLEFEGKRMVVEPGTAMILYFPHDNRYWLPEGGDWEFFYICMNGRELLRIFQAVIEKTGPLIRLGSESEILRTAAKICLSIKSGDISSPWSASLMAYKLAIKIAERFLPSEPGHQDRPRPESIEKAIQYCLDNLASSRITNRGSEIMARAIAMRCR